MRSILGLLIYFSILSSCFGLENTFYVLRDQKQQALQALAAHSQLANILIFQTFVIHSKGDTSGTPDKDIIAFSKANHTKLLAMVTNSRFDAEITHQFLINPLAQKKALITLIEACKKYQLDGVQFDFEMMPLTDKKYLTAFYELAAQEFHKNHLMISFAIAPTLMDTNFSSFYQKKLYTVWQGVYDFKKLGAISDFVTIMAYDQHGIGTIPGPIASLPWVEKVIQHAITLIPVNKISLGIPTYSGFWYMNETRQSKRIITQYNSLDYKTLQYIQKKYQPPILWDNLNKINFSFYDSAGLNKYIFMEDARSFKAKRDLATKYRLRGISVFRLGIEDPEIWDILAKNQ